MKIYRILYIRELVMWLLFSSTVFAQNMGQVNGFVKDASNGEGLSYANIIIKGTQLGASSKKNGYYFIENITPGKYVLTASYMGYKESSKEIMVEQGRTIRCNFELEPSPIELKGLSVSAERTRFERDITISTFTMKKTDLEKASIVGEADIFRSLQLLPGVIGTSDFSSQLYVRGGSPDQNLILLDGITVYNPTHLGGLFTTFNADAISDVELMAGGFPAKYGGRMSSILNITSKDGNSKKFSMSSSISILSAKTLLEGPLPKGSWMGSIRRSYFDILFKNTRFDFPYYFYDGMGKVNFDLTANSNVSVAGVLGEDVLNFLIEEDDEELGKLDMRWGNRGLSGKWRQILNPRLYGEVLFAWSNFRTSMNLEFQESGFRFSNEIVDYTAKGDFTYILAPNHTLDFGFDAKNITFDFNVEIDTIKYLDDIDTAKVLALYLQDKWEINPLFILQAGIRPTYFSPGSRLRLEPRLGLKYRVASNTTLNASFGLYSQSLTTVNSGEELFSIFDIWLPIGEEYAPGLSTHYILGVEQWISDDFIFSTEGYYKKFEHLVELNQEEFGEDDFYKGSGYATGLDFLLKKSRGRLSGWASYSLSLTKRTFNNETYCPRYDRRHNLSLTFELALPWRLKLNFTQLVGTGFPYPGVIGRYPKTEYDFSGDSLITDWEEIMAPRDYYRYPTNHRADIGISKAFTWKSLKGEFSIEIINLYNHKNVFFYIWDLEEDSPVKRAVTMFPLLPTIGLKVNF
ncbi:MAG: hypothetical protein E3J87_08840 [Candidatus Cloacimonadota bacterium]|nr:MAG: hypothetical protein E3J87_08840 [Candidatus Cloacimonadota bacterium]